MLPNIIKQLATVLAIKAIVLPVITLLHLVPINLVLKELFHFVLLGFMGLMREITLDIAKEYRKRLLKVILQFLLDTWLK